MWPGDIRHCYACEGPYCSIERVRLLYAVIERDFESSFLVAASFIAFSISLFLSSSSFICFSSFSLTDAGLSGLLNVMLLLWLVPAPMEPVAGVDTDTMSPLVERPRWKVEGRTRPGGCWNVQLARVHPAPNRQGWVLRWGCTKVHPGRVQLRPNRQGTVLVG